MNSGDSPIDRLTKNGFLKTSTAEVSLPPEDKARLNLKGNQLLNAGSVDQAKKIFLTTRYSDGLCRIGDYYKEKGDPITALKFYTLSGRKDKSDPFIQTAVQVIRAVLKEDKTNTTETENK